MSIKELEKRKNEYCEYVEPKMWQVTLVNFMNEVINCFEEMENKYEKKRIHKEKKEGEKIKANQK